jgi:hypothetical protein
METFMPAPGKNYKGPMLPQFVLGKEITFGAKVMYAVLCNYSARYNTDHCDPSHSTLAQLLSCGITSVKRYLAELTGAKLIRIELRERESNIYYMLKPDALDDVKDDYGKQKATMSPHVASREPQTVRQQSKVAHSQSKMDSPQTKVGYITKLNKKQEETTNPPLPPVPVSRSVPPASKPMGGGDFSFQDFEKLYEAYPRKEDKGNAIRAYKQLLKSGMLPPLPDLLAAVKRFASSEKWKRENGRFIPYLSNFLTGQRWLDPLSSEEEAVNYKRIEAEQLSLAHKREVEAGEARNREKKRRLRLIYDAFAERFGDEAKQTNERIDHKNFGTWMFHYGKYQGPTAADVPDGNTLCIADFMTEYQRRRDAEAYYAAQQTPVAARDSQSHSDNRKRKPMSCAEILRGGGNLMAKFWPAPQPLCAAAV